MKEKDWEKKVAMRLHRDLEYSLLTNLEKLVVREELRLLSLKSGGQEKEADTMQPTEILKKNPSLIQYDTGAKRSEKMPRYDLIPKCALDRLAQRFTGHMIDGIPSGGALKYGEGNWEKGLPTSDVINHIINHLTQYQDFFRIELSTGIKDGLKGNELMNYIQNSLQSCSRSDDDLAGAMWGLTVLMYQEENRMFHDDSFLIKDESIKYLPCERYTEHVIIDGKCFICNKTKEEIQHEL